MLFITISFKPVKYKTETLSWFFIGQKKGGLSQKIDSPPFTIYNYKLFYQSIGI